MATIVMYPKDNAYKPKSGLVARYAYKRNTAPPPTPKTVSSTGAS